ncbi:type II secretion system F family protein [Candidatus Woesearchaeota archaeon]|nr:type II secretion system F family protein [Candidatus Woesearchaeota archaeon]
MLSDKIAKSFPHLKLHLAQAEIKTTPEKFVKQNLKLSFYLSFALVFTGFLFLYKIKPELIVLLILLFPVVYFMSFIYLMNTPAAKAKKAVREIDKEIVFAGRFLLVELSAGVPLFNAMDNVSRSYPLIGRYFKEIIDRAEVGKPIDEAITEVMELTPSDNFRKLLWQIMNSLRTGADVSAALNSILEQIAREQLIKMKEYGKKLNPMVMFYLMIAVIVPSLGVTMLSLLSSFIGLSIGFGTLLGIAIGTSLVQIIFLVSIKQSRPGVSI